MEPELVNPTVGEDAAVVPASALGPEAGFYVRRGQTAEVRPLPGLAPGRHDVRMELGLAGVTTTILEQVVELG